jgi:hypothetical protein
VFGTGYAVAVEAFGPKHFSCSWAERIVVPLTFNRTPADCPASTAAFTAAGSPMLARAMDSWMAALCVGPQPVTFGYNPAVSEPSAIAEAGTGQADVALTTRSASAQGIGTGGKPVVYAPVAVSAVSISYWFDNPVTGQPYTGIKLSQRLVLKLLTQSYAFENDGCPSPAGNPCDNGVDDNRLNLFNDPDFLRLNPEFGGTTPQDSPPVNGYLEIPTVARGPADTTWTVTRWIAASPPAKAFLKGYFDPYGMHINTHFYGTRYPTNAFAKRDYFPFIWHLFNPVPFSQVATDQVENWPPWHRDQKDQFGKYERLPPELSGQRALVAITGQGDSAAFLFPTAAIPNGAGHFTQPNDAGMAAAVQTMIPAGDGTQQVDVHSTNPAVYPLTMVIYAMAPTSGLSHTKAAAIAHFIDYAASTGQTPGLRTGQLPRGFLPLTAALRAQARKAAQEILSQSGGTTS